jgi:glycosyltransferase involved in cell wall biosynthesis
VTRSVLMGTVYNPFMIRYFLENFKTWQDKVDALYICLDRLHCKEVESYLAKEIEKFPKIKIRKGLIGFPENIRGAILETEEDLILTIHDDIYVYNPEIIDRYFNIASEGKIIMPLQSIFAPADEVREAINKRYPSMPWKIDDYSSYSFIMYFTFCSRENYLKTNIDFNGNTYDAGYIKELDHTFKDKWGGELGFLQGLQFLYHNIEIVPIKANQLADIPHKQNPFKEFTLMVEGGLDWLHLQNIARTIPLWFITEEEWYGNTVDRTQHKVHSMESWRGNQVILEDMALKIAWLKEYLSVDNYEEIKDFYSYIKEEIEYIIDYMEIDRAKVGDYTKAIKRL